MGKLLAMLLGFCVAIGAAVVIMRLARYAIAAVRWLGCVGRRHDTVPLKRIGKDAFVGGRGVLVLQ